MSNAKYATGKYAFAICDRCGLRFPYLELHYEERTGLWVCEQDYDKIHPQERPIRRASADPQGLRRPRPDRVEPPVPQLGVTLPVPARILSLASLDTVLSKKGVRLNASLDLVLSFLQSRSTGASFDALLQQALAKTVSLDAAFPLNATQMVQLGTDSLLQRMVAATASLDTTIQGQVAQQTFSFSVANADTSNVTSPQVSMGHLFARGDVPAGSSLQLATDDLATVIPVQQDGESYWNDGSLKFAVLSFIAPYTMTPGTPIPLKLQVVAAEPNRTPAVSLDDIVANSDIKMKFFDFDTDPDTYTVSVNEIAQNASNWPWGANPTWGWEITRSGPIATEYRLWAFLKRDRDGVFHNWLKCTIYVKAWGKTGPFEVYTHTRQGNAYGPAWGTAGAGGSDAKEPRFIYAAELWDGTTLVKAFAGANSSRVIQIPPENFDPTTGIIDCGVNVSNSAPYLFSGAVGFADNDPWFFMFSNGIYGPDYHHAYVVKGRKMARGSVPSNWQASHSYSLWSIVKHGAIFYICTTAGTTGTTGPTGTGADIVDGTAVWRSTSALIETQTNPVTAIPMIITFAHTGWVGCADDGRSVWIGGTQPKTLVQHDFAYFTNKTRFAPPYVQTADPSPYSSAADYYPGFATFPVDLSQTGDNPGDDRIGYINHTALLALFNPLSEPTVKNARVRAFGITDYVIHMEDERGGKPVVFTAGPLRDNLTPYQDFAYPPNCQYWPYGQPPNLAAFKSGGNPRPTDVDTSMENSSCGYSFRYGNLVDSSHLPAPWTVPYILTGAQIFMDIGVFEASAEALSAYRGSYAIYTIGDTKYSAVVMKGRQGRGCGWATRLMGHTYHLIAQNDPFYPVIRDSVSDTGAYLAAWYKTITDPKALYFGLFNPNQNGNSISPNNIGASWHNAIAMLGCGVEAWRDEFPGYRDFMTNYWRNYIRVYDSDEGGCEYYLSGALDVINFSSDGTLSGVYDTSGEVLTANLGAGWTCPADGIGGLSGTVASSGTFSWDDTNWSVFMIDAILMFALLGDARAIKLWNRIQARVAGFGGIKWLNVPDWAFTMPWE